MEMPEEEGFGEVVDDPFSGGGDGTELFSAGAVPVDPFGGEERLEMLAEVDEARDGRFEALTLANRRKRVVGGAHGESEAIA